MASFIVTRFYFTLTLPPPVAFVAEEMFLDWPAFLASHSWLEHHGTVLTLKALQMVIPVQGPHPGGFGLSFLGYNGSLAASTYHTELLGVVLNTVDFVLAIQGHWLTLHVLFTYHTSEAAMVEGDPSHREGVSGRQGLSTGRATAKLCQLCFLVAGLTEHPALQGEQLPSDDGVTHLTRVAYGLVVVLTDGEVLVGEIPGCLDLPTNLTLHTPWVEEFLVDLNMILCNFGLAHFTLV